MRSLFSQVHAEGRDFGLLVLMQVDVNQQSRQPAPVSTVTEAPTYSVDHNHINHST